MTPPKARCVTCLTVIQEHDPRKTTQRPRYCSKPECRDAWKANPICARCRKKLHPPFHIATRYHDHCKFGCAYCGGLLPPPPGSSVRKATLDYLYCTKECRNAAWEGQPLPVCPECNQTVDFEPQAHIWRNPPLYHHDCRPDSAPFRRTQVLRKAAVNTEFSKAYRERYRPIPPNPYPDGDAIILEFCDEYQAEYAPNEDLQPGGWDRDEAIRHPLQPVDRCDPYDKNVDLYTFGMVDLLYIPWVVAPAKKKGFSDELTYRIDNRYPNHLDKPYTPPVATDEQIRIQEEMLANDPLSTKLKELLFSKKTEQESTF